MPCIAVGDGSVKIWTVKDVKAGDSFNVHEKSVRTGHFPTPARIQLVRYVGPVPHDVKYGRGEIPLFEHAVVRHNPHLTGREQHIIRGKPAF